MPKKILIHAGWDLLETLLIVEYSTVAILIALEMVMEMEI
jgi:hypothetical protein